MNLNLFLLKDLTLYYISPFIDVESGFTIESLRYMRLYLGLGMGPTCPGELAVLANLAYLFFEDDHRVLGTVGALCQLKQSRYLFDL